MKKHEYIYDYLRVIACIFVIGIHVTGDRYDFTGAYAGMVFRIGLPVFFILSGALLLNERSGEPERILGFYLKRLIRVVVPFFLYGLIYSAWIGKGYGFLHIPDMTMIKTAIRSVPEGIMQIISGDLYFHFWFMYAMLGIYILMPFLKIMVNHMSRKVLLQMSAVIFIIQLIFTYIPLFGVKIGVENLFANWVMYTVFGYILVQDFAGEYYKRLIGAGIIAYMVSATIRYLVPGLSVANFYDISPHMILESCGFFAVFLLFRERITKWKWMNKLVAFFSRYAFSVYMIHGYVVSMVNCRMFGLSNETLGGILLTIFVVFSFSFAFAFLFDNIVTKNVQRLMVKIMKLNFLK